VASVTAIRYSETRNKDDSVFSRTLEATITLNENELPYDEKLPTFGDLLIKFVKNELDGKCPEFKTPEPVKELEKPQEQKLKVDHTVGAFNRNVFMWEHCPRCGSTKIKHKSEKGTYYACFDCRVWLNKDSHNTPTETEMTK
jgi:hypothetical protein